MRPRVDDPKPGAFDAAKELIARDPYRDIRRWMQFAVGSSVATIASVVAAALNAHGAWLAAVSLAGVSAAAWTGVVIGATGRRARVREAFAAYLSAETAREALLHVVQIHRAALDASAKPETVRVRMHELLESAEQSGIATSLENWEAFKAGMLAEVESKRLAAELKVAEQAAQHGRLLLMRAEDRARRREIEHAERNGSPLPVKATIAVRKAPPRLGRERFSGLVFDGPGQMPDLPGAHEEQDLSDEKVRVPHVPAYLTSEKARWAPFAAPPALTRELLDLFGDPGEVHPPMSDLQTARHENMQAAFVDGYRSAQRGVVLASSAAGELMAPTRPHTFARVVSEARAVVPAIGIGEVPLRSKD